MADLRIDFPGCRHHVYNRGVRRQHVFTSDADRALFLELLSELPGRFGVPVLAFALMDNHFHLLLVAEHGNLSKAMHFLLSSFVPRCNARNGWEGPMFRSRFQSRVALDEDYWTTLLFYVHLNPAEAGNGAWTADPLRTSDAYYRGSLPAPGWLDTAELLALAGGHDGYRARFDDHHDGVLAFPDVLADGRCPALVGRSGALGLQQPPSDLTHRDVGRALEAVRAITGADLDELLVGQKGCRGSQARRLAVWWLVQVGVPRGDIAEVTGLSPAGIASIASRARRAGGQLARWRSLLLQEEGWSGFGWRADEVAGLGRPGRVQAAS